MIGFAALAGCDLLDPSAFRSEIVVSGFLEAGSPLSEIRVSQTVPMGETYDADDVAVRDALVTVQLLQDDGAVEEEYGYEFLPESAGIYTYSSDGSEATAGVRLQDVVLPLRTYRLVIEVPGYDRITSTTIVPDTFSVRTVSADTVTYQSSEPFTFEVATPRYPGRQSLFIFTTTALDGLEEQLTPFARNLVEEGEDVTLADLRERVSPILNEESFNRSQDGAVEIQFPWLAIYFYGRNRVSVQALDDNLYDFFRSQSVQQGGSTRPPGEIPNVLDPIENGRGIFGSYADARVDFYVLPREE